MSTNCRRDDILDHLNWRYATKTFDPARQISEEDWRTLEEALRLSPSSYGLQPWRFIDVRSSEIRKQLAAVAPFNGAKFEAASHILVLTRLRAVTPAYIDRHLDRMSRTRQIPREDLQPFQDMVTNRIGGWPAEMQAQWTARQTYVALGVFLTTAALLDIDACAMEGIEPEKFDEVLGLVDTDYATVVAVAAGYRSDADSTRTMPKVRFDREEIFSAI